MISSYSLFTIEYKKKVYSTAKHFQIVTCKTCSLLQISLVTMDTYLDQPLGGVKGAAGIKKTLYWYFNDYLTWDGFYHVEIRRG